MKKTFKRMLTTALAITMMLTMFAMPASAGDDSTVLFTGNMADIDLSAVASKTGNTAYEAGTAWGSSGTVPMTSGFTYDSESGYMWSTTVNMGSAQYGGLLHKFEPISNGETLKLTAKAKFHKSGASNKAFTFALSNSDESYRLSLFRFRRVNYRGFALAGLGVNPGYYGANEQPRGDEIYWLSCETENNWHDFENDSTFPIYSGYDVPVEFTMAPNSADASKYDLTITIGDETKVTPYTATRQINATDAIALNTVALYNGCNQDDGDGKFVGIKDVVVSKGVAGDEPEGETPATGSTKTFILMNQHMSTADHPSSRLTKGTTGGDLLTNTAAYPLFAEGKEWGAEWAPLVGVTVDDAGLNFGTAATMTDSGNWTCFRKIFTLNPASENRDMRFTYDIKTGTKTATNLTVRTCIDSPMKEQLFLYDAQNCTVQFAGTNPYYAWNSDTEVIQLAENTDYTLVIDYIWDDAASRYDLVCEVLNGENRVGNVQVVDNYTFADGNTDWERLGFFAKWTEAATDAVTALTVKNIKIEETAEKTITFDDEYNYSNERVLLDEKTADLDLTNDVVALTSAEYTSGKKWGVYANGISANMAFEVQNGFLYCKGYDNQYGKFGEITKKFEPIEDGETLILKTTIDPNGLYGLPAANDWCGLALGLESSTMNNGMDAFLFNTRQWTSSALWTFARTKVTGAEGGKYTLGNANAGAVTLADQWINPTNKGEFYCSGGIDFTLTLAPSTTEGKYTATVTAVNPYAAFLSEEARTKTATKEIDKALALSFDTIRINTALQTTQQAGTVGKRFAGLKDIKLTAKNASKTALTVGANTIYLPVTNITEAPVDYQVVAAVCKVVGGEEQQISFGVSEAYTANASEHINLAVDVEIEDPEAEYVKLYVFDKFETIVPYVMPISNTNAE